jgi:hypothetical protein
MDRRPHRCQRIAHLRATTVVTVLDPTLTVVGPATPIRRHPISIGSDANEVRRLRPASRGFCGASDVMQVRVMCAGCGEGRCGKRCYRGNRASDHSCANHCVVSLGHLAPSLSSLSNQIGLLSFRACSWLQFKTQVGTKSIREPHILAEDTTRFCQGLPDSLGGIFPTQRK